MGKVLNSMYYFGNSKVGFGNIKRINQQGESFDADYQAVLDYATTQGYTLPSAAQQILQNTVVSGLKTAGIWAKLDTLAVFATDGDSNFALIDWVRLSVLTSVNSPTFTINQGYNGDGSTSYVRNNADFTTFTNYSQNSASLFRYKYNNVTVGTAGSYDGFRISGPTALSLMSTADNYVNSGFTAMNIPAISTIGTHLNVRQDSNNIEAFINGVSVASRATSASTGIPNIPYFIGAYNISNSPVFPHNTIISVHGAGSDLTAEQADLNTIITDYMTSI